MPSIENSKNIPPQENGGQTNTSHSITFKTENEAKELFIIAQNRLLNVSEWHLLCGSASTVFKLTDSYGNEVKRNAKPGDFFKIDVPGPGTITGKGFDWVQVQNIIDNSNANNTTESISMLVRPSANPQNLDPSIAHFFKDAATSTFLVKRFDKTLTAEVHGRNEIPNTRTRSIIDIFRNAIVALGAMLGISNPQWKCLVKGLLKKQF